MVYTGNRHANKIGAAGDVVGVCTIRRGSVPAAGWWREPIRLSGRADVFGHREERERGILNAPTWALQ